MKKSIFLNSFSLKSALCSLGKYTQSIRTFRSSADSAASPQTATRDLCRRIPIFRRQDTVNMKVCLRTAGKRDTPKLISFHSSENICCFGEKNATIPHSPHVQRCFGGRSPRKFRTPVPGGAGKQPDTPKIAAYTGSRRCRLNFGNGAKLLQVFCHFFL